MEFQQALELLQKDLSEVEKRLRDYTISDISLIPVVTNYLADGGGKRIRPLLVLICAKLCRYQGEEDIIHSCIVEFIHNATLLHDDVIDGSEMRRGNPSVNARWGNEASILLGDFLFSKSFWLLAKYSNFRVMESLSKAALNMAEGEIAQLLNSCNLSTTEEDYMEVIRRKTAELMASCCQIGAILGKAPYVQEKALTNFGLKIGMAFQLVDDVLDYSAQEEKLGKSIGKDFREGKVTLPLVRLYSECLAEEKDWIRANLGNKKINSEELNYLLEIMEQYEVLKSTIDLAKSYVASAKEELKVFSDSLYREALISVADYIVSRDY
jgi:octaprenyl-diphosphate synthase